MERGIDDRNILDNFALDFCKIAEKHVKYIVVSGFVAISHGRRRTTEDIDMIIEKMSFEKFKLLHKGLDRAGFHCLQSEKAENVYDYLKNGDSIRYLRKGTFLPPEMEVKFVKDEIDEIQIKTRKKLDFTGLNIWFSSIEFNIAFKEELLKGNKDLEDAKHLRIIYKDEIDNDFIENIKEKIRRLRLRKAEVENER
ncbi:MAG: hypothetical protein WD876_02265 [Candidatus Pacearchaeota archaeon]